MPKPLLSVVVLNYNAREYIAGCLESVFESSYEDLEVILVDNHSTDGSIAHLRAVLPSAYLSRIVFIENGSNHGAAVALNQGAGRARGAFISFVATDTVVDRECFSRLIQAAESDPGIGALSAKLLMMHKPGYLDSAGEYLNQFGLLMQRHAGKEQDLGQFDEPAEIFSAKGTALTVRAEVFRRAGGYPEDYFMFLEETDLCWRIWLLGYRIIFVSQARIYHACGASIGAHKNKSYLVKYFGCRNYIRTLWKNLGVLYWLRIVPLHICLWLVLALYFVARLRFMEGVYLLRAVVWIFLHPLVLLRQRNAAQQLRRLSDRELMPKIMRPVKISYLMARVGMW